MINIDFIMFFIAFNILANGLCATTFNIEGRFNAFYTLLGIFSIALTI